jgi:hypothetical protein
VGDGDLDEKEKGLGFIVEFALEDAGSFLEITFRSCRQADAKKVSDISPPKKQIPSSGTDDPK